MDRILKNGKKVEICKYDDKVFKLLFRTLKDFRLFSLYKIYGADEIKETCYISRCLHVPDSESIFQNYLYWPFDLGSVDNVSINISEPVKALYSLVFGARIIKSVLVDNKINQKSVVLIKGFFNTFFQRLSDFICDYKQILREYKRLKNSIDFIYFLEEINDSVKIIKDKYGDYYKNNPYSTNSYCSFLKSEYGIEI